MLPADTYVMRLATEQDADDLRRLAALDSARPLTGEVLIGEIDGVPAAARSLETGRTIADPFHADRSAVRVPSRARGRPRGGPPRAAAEQADARRGAPPGTRRVAPGGPAPSG